MDALSTLPVTFNNAFPPALVEAASEAWPAQDWHWTVHYASDRERLRVCRAWAHFPPPVRLLFGYLMSTSPLLVGGVPDGSLLCAGMRSFCRGGRFEFGADCRQALAPWHVRAGGILYLNDWQEEWGGGLELRGDDWCKTVLPAANRLVIFEVGNGCRHGLTVTTACPEDQQLKTLSLFWFAPTLELEKG